MEDACLCEGSISSPGDRDFSPTDSRFFRYFSLFVGLFLGSSRSCACRLALCCS